MSESISIEGWTCRVVRGQRSAMNYATSQGAWYLPSGTLKTECGNVDGESETAIPPAVLRWLVAPLFEKADQSAATETEPGVISDLDALDFTLDAPPEMVPGMLDAIRQRRSKRP